MRQTRRQFLNGRRHNFGACRRNPQPWPPAAEAEAEVRSTKYEVRSTDEQRRERPPTSVLWSEACEQREQRRARRDSASAADRFLRASPRHS
jgi:hypothetical protein